MDPLAHTLTGAVLAETALARRRDGGKIPLATATLLIGANLPDVDVLTYFHGADFALQHRRGWTHGVLAMVAWPLLLTGAVLLWDRFVRRRGRDPKLPVPPATILTLSYMAVLTHPILDWLNTYGIRLLMPFDDRWFYGDAVFIMDPWIWLILGSAVVIARAPLGRREATLWTVLAALTTALLALGGPRPTSTTCALTWALWLGGIGATAWAARGHGRSRARRLAGAVGSALVVAYCTGMVTSAQIARTRVIEIFDQRGVELTAEGYRPGDAYRLMVGPVPVTPLRKQVVAATGEAYRIGALRWTGDWTLELEDALPRPEPGARTDAVLTAPETRGFTTWVRFPWIAETGGDDLFLLDARYTSRPTTGFGGTRVPFSAK